MCLATGQSFKQVLSWLELIKKKESGEIMKPNTTMIPAKKMRAGQEKEYSRYKQEDFKNPIDTGGFKIDTLGTNASKSFNALVGGKKLMLML